MRRATYITLGLLCAAGGAYIGSAAIFAIGIVFSIAAIAGPKYDG